MNGLQKSVSIFPSREEKDAVISILEKVNWYPVLTKSFKLLRVLSNILYTL